MQRTQVRWAGHPLVARPAGREVAAGIADGLFAVRVPRREMVAFVRGLAAMLGARIPLVQALTLAEQQAEHRGFRRALALVRRDVLTGASLSHAFAARDGVFDRMVVQLARVGEAAGVLDQVLLRLAAHLERVDHYRRRVLSAMAYPALILVVATGAVAFLLGAIVPTFAQLFADFGAELPLSTRVVLSVSGAVTDHLLLAVAVAGMAGAGVAAWKRTPAGRLAWDRALLRLPLLRRLVLGSVAARFCRTLGTLLESGVPLDEALDVLGATLGNRAAEVEVARVAECVRRGSSLSQPLRKGGLLPEPVVQMIAVGEETGELAAMLIHVAAFYEEELDVTLDGLTSLVEPVLIVLIGLVLGGILTALYLPMFDLLNVVS